MALRGAVNFHSCLSSRMSRTCQPPLRRATQAAVRAGQCSAQFVDGSRPAFLQQPRQGAVRQNHAAGLTAGAVVGLVLRVDDALHRRAAYRTGLAVAAVHRHFRPECRDVLGKRRAGLAAQPLRPFREDFPRRIEQPRYLRRGQLLRLRERRQPRPMQDLVALGVADAREGAGIGQRPLEGVILRREAGGEIGEPRLQ